jgi:acyl-[acyl-carrier-protein] desaturase
MNADAVLTELRPTVESLVDRHLASAKEWFPHELVPYSRGRDFVPGETWNPDDCPMPTVVRDAWFVNLLTEDNLPHYFETINRVFGADEAWGLWSKRWTAEEGRHSIVMRDYLTVTRAVDPIALERGRMDQIALGAVPQPATPCDGLAYVALQELATRISHMNTGRLMDDPAGYEIMKRVAGDENRHYLFYRDLVTAALALDPSNTMCAIDRQVRDFEMPGTGIHGFAEKAKAIAKAGIYDFKIHLEQILKPVLHNHWKISEVTGLNDDGKRAQEKVIRYLERLEKVAHRFVSSEPALV